MLPVGGQAGSPLATIQQERVRGDYLGFAGGAVARSVVQFSLQQTAWARIFPPYQYCGKLEAMTSSSMSELEKSDLEYIFD